jgi:hypothetical protein
VSAVTKRRPWPPKARFTAPRDVDLADERAARFEHLDAAARRRVDEPVGVDLDASG